MEAYPVMPGNVDNTDSSMSASPAQATGQDVRAPPAIRDVALDLEVVPSPASASSPAQAPPASVAAVTSRVPESAAVEARPSERKSYQLRALVCCVYMRSVYQKRQVFVNVCCISLCPLMMVVLAVVLGSVVGRLITKATVVQEFLCCSNAMAMDLTQNAPQVDIKRVPQMDGSLIKGATPGILVNLINFITGASDSSCVFWKDKTFNFTSPYQLDPFSDIPIAISQYVKYNSRRDSTFQPDVKYGWLNDLVLTQKAYLVSLSDNQQYPWAIMLEGDNQNLGWKNQTAPVTSKANFVNSSAETGKEGFLGRFPSYYFANNTYTVISSDTPSTTLINITVKNFESVPYFRKARTADGASVDSLNTELVSILRQTLDGFSTVDRSAIFDTNASADASRKFKMDISSLVKRVPWGIITWQTYNPSSMSYAYTMQVGTDSRVANAAGFPTQGFRRFFLQMKEVRPTFTLNQGLRVMPKLISTLVDLPIAAYVGRILYPFAMSFLLPIFVITLVREKEDRILVIMKMNGLKSFVYYLTHYVHFYVLHTLACVVFIVTGVICKMEFFVRTDPVVYILHFFLWGHAQIALAFFFASMFSKSRNALVVTFLIVLMNVIINTATQRLFVDRAPGVYMIWPPFAFYRALTNMNTASFSKKIPPYSMSTLAANDEVATAMVYLTVETIVFLVLAVYLNNVLPSQFSVRKPWHYIVTEPYDHFSGRAKKRLEEDRNNYAAVVSTEETKHEDEDVRAERTRVDNNQHSPDCPLVIRHMRKIYPGTHKIAVKDVTFAAESDTVFGLLGPNGAGKTSLISILTGLYEPTLGEATLGGYNIITQREDVYRITGVCPQHDILWDDLTVGEHLLFYARLKGIPPEQEQEAKDMSMKTVSLQAFENRLSKGLSGGEKRRLSIAISLIGQPKIVFLDEPTTGLDPEVRRLIWDIIITVRKGKTVVLTTHSMEEAEVLCQRIGIMAKGTLRCIGPQLRLKQLYGSGFKLSLISQPKHLKEAAGFVESLLPMGFNIVGAFANSMTYEFLPEKGTIPALFQKIELHKVEHHIDDWGISQTSLEEVFLKIISETDAEGSVE